MLKRVLTLFPLLGLVFFNSCSQAPDKGAVTVQVIRPSAGHCKYEFKPVRLETLDDLSTMQGRVGRIVTSSKEVTDASLAAGTDLSPVKVEFSRSGNVYYPVDTTSVFAASLYYSLENSYQLVKNLDPSIDLARLVPNLPDTRVVLNAKSKVAGERGEVQDNAEFLPLEVNGVDGRRTLLNYFFAYPTNAIEGVPLGVNLGIMTHEYSHLVFQHLFYEPGTAQALTVGTSKPTESTLAALDEGMADYFGYLATQDPGYFLCSFPSENRDLAVPKSFTQKLVASIGGGASTYFDPHEGGAVWASIQYEIGNVIGHQENGKALLQLMSNLLTCASTRSGNSLSFHFGDVARCHQAVLGQNGRDVSTVQQIYSKYLGSYGGGQ